jgi:ribosomal peptide maturation radical SAM protein 1
MTTGPVDIALVRMPYSEIGQPSLALGLLKACCARHGLSTRVLSANLWFAEELGPAIHDLVFESYSTTLVGEWTFAGALFPDFHPDDDAYLRKVIKIFRMDSSSQWRSLHERYPYLDFMLLLREIRRRAGIFVERAADRILALDPKIVGCTSTFQQHCASLALLRIVKQRRPEVITMIGGANCDADMGRVTFEQFPWLDFVVSGEADGFFGPMCEKVLRSGIEAVLPELPDGVFGPHHRRNQAAIGQAVDGAPIARLEDMNESPIPNYDDYFAALEDTMAFGEHLRPALPFQTARGCWWGEKTHCSFCGISKTAMKFRAKSSDNVMDQMLTLRDRYGINLFQGTEYIFDYKFFKTLLPRLKELDSYFRFEVKANLKIEQLEAFIESGTIELQPGVESLHDGLLHLLEKGVTAFQNVQLLKRGRKVGMSIFWNMLHTIPGDCDEMYGEMAELVPLLTHLQPPSAFAQIHYDRFSPYWRAPAQYGLTLQPAFGYEYVYPFPAEVLRDTAYFFETPRQRAEFLQYDRSRHPGLFRLIDAVDRWTSAARSRSAWPKLVATDLGDTIAFEDTRELASSTHFEIEGLERRIYRIAEDGVAPAYLMRRLEAGEPGGACSEEEVRVAVQRLIDRKILTNLSGRLVGLAIAAPMKPMAAQQIVASKEALNPTFGKMNADRLLDQKRPSIALSCIRLPQDEPLSRWLADSSRSAMSPRPARAPADDKALSPVPRSPVPYHAPKTEPRYIPLQPVYS